MSKIKDILFNHYKKIVAVVLLVIAFLTDLITHHDLLNYLKTIFLGA